MRLLASRVIAILFSAHVVAQSAHITGTVLDSRGEAVEQATVFAYPEGPIGGIVPSGVSDALGHFHIRIIQPVWEKWDISASKESAGYGGEPFIFPSPPNARPVVVDLSAKQPTADVIVHLGKRSGVLSGSVTDEATGRLLQTTTEIRWTLPTTRRRALRQPGGLGGSGLVSGNFHVLVPSDLPFSLKVWSEGYQQWYYKDSQHKLSMKPGEELRLEIKLKRIPER